ncbi:DUF960 family protein [Clostridium butyricum]|uniref:DUF960 family protein n=1 Tax=Clostridium butyricum TaxID=1492 RepID=UPI003F5C3155
MFKQENRYVSRQVNEVVPIQLQILMWSMIDSLKEKKIGLPTDFQTKSKRR